MNCPDCKNKMRKVYIKLLTSEVVMAYICIECWSGYQFYEGGLKC